MHDVLGHSLTALSIKAELATGSSTSTPTGPAPSSPIQETARQALAEMRATVGGLRVAGLDAELGRCPAAGRRRHRARPSGDVADADPRHRALLAWVLREAVTNVVRHAQRLASPSSSPRPASPSPTTAAGRARRRGQRAARHARAGDGGRRDAAARPATPRGPGVEVALP